MTTVAVRDGVMASDSASEMDGVLSKVKKMYRAKDGSIIGLAGNIGQGIAFVRWYDKKGKGEKPDMDDAYALVLKPTGEVISFDCTLEPFPISEPFTAIGSGAQLAMAAMLAGADAKRAVQIACKIDPHSGLGVVALKPC